MKLRIFRLFICFLLVCCLLVRISPIQAKAATLTGTVAAGTAIAAGLVALGIGVGATETTFNNLVDSLTAVAGSDRVPVWISETADGFVTYLQESFLGSLLAHCFDSGVVSDSRFQGFSTSASGPVWAGSNYGFQSASAPMRTVMCICFQSGIPNLYFYTLSSVQGAYFFPYGNASVRFYCDQVSAAGYYNLRSSPLGMGTNGNSASKLLADYPNHAYISYSDTDSGRVADCPFWGGISTSEDLTLGSVGASMSSPNYDPWRSNAIPVVPPVVGGGTADEEDALPVTFPGLDTPSITGQTQTGAQSGVTPGTVVEDILSGGEVVPETGTGTIADVIAAIKAIPASLADFFADVVAAVQAIPAAIADVFTPSGAVEVYSLDLKQFFPFCIPYDIYSMLAALAADPVAPKFDFEIDLGPVGILPISVDFSEWDDVAALLRTCEAAIFAVGLAVKTKELIGW